MKKTTIAMMSLAILGLVSCKNEGEQKKALEEVKETTVTTEKVMEQKKQLSKELSMKLVPKSESNASGRVTFNEKGGVVSFTALLSGLSEGTHAIHIHEKADCSSADGKSTGGHWNPTLSAHGKWGAAEGYHKGDIGNFEVDTSGNGTISMTTDQWCIGCGDEKKDILGKAIIVHQGADDFTSQPSGAAGARVSCGGIIQ